MSEPLQILVVDDQRNHAEVLAELLERAGHRVRVATTADTAKALLEERPFDLLVTDLDLGGSRGTELMREAKRLRPGIECMVVSGVGEIEDAVEVMQQGALHYFTKPLQAKEVRDRIARWVEERGGTGAAPGGDDLLEGEDRFQGIVGKSPAMQRVFAMIEQIAPTTATVLVNGEPGTGKELVARAIHRLSPRKERPFVALNCGALSEGILESELFGHEKGAFTGAAKSREGKFEYADGGTLFLDEIGDMPLGLQVKLLRVVQEREVVRLGSNRTIKVDVRLIAATNKDLEVEVREGRFREDLYWRLRVVSLQLPPLRERTGDVVPLARSFVADFARRHGRAIEGISEDALERLRRHEWPGNVRELQNACETMVLLGQGPVLGPDDLPPDIRQAERSSSTALVALEDLGEYTLDQWERELIKVHLERSGGNRARAARALGISERTLYRKLKEYDLS